MIASMTLEELRHVTGGERSGNNVSFDAVSTDTRAIRTGELFVALKGPNFNGNSFVEVAREKGAVAAMVSEVVDTPLPTVRVADSRIALGQLGRANRRRSDAVVIGLTGSQGKTSVKEMTAAILSCRGAVHATRGNLNNDIGVPLTLLQITSQHRFAVIEMGANAPGEIACMTRLVEPDIALINNVAPTHLEGFGSLEGVATSKSEIWQGLGGEGRAVVNLDDALIPRHVVVRGRQVVVGISASGKPNADYGIESVEDLGLEGSHFTMWTPKGTRRLRLWLPGMHNVANALAASALAMEAGASLDDVAQGLDGMRSVKGRLVVRRGFHGATIIDDTYNASPSSFKAAIDVLARRPGRRVVVAGDMAELGSEEHSAHRDLGLYARELGIEHFLGTGELARIAVQAFGNGGAHAADWESLVAVVLPLLDPRVTVLVKGSRSAGMERVVKKLMPEEE